MKKVTTTIKSVAALLIIAVTLTFTSCTNNSGNSSSLQAKVDSLQNELKKFTDEKALTEMRIAKFDTLDFDFIVIRSGTSLPTTMPATSKSIIPMAA